MAVSEQPVVSRRFPYIPLHLRVQDHDLTDEAMLDTGFDGAIVVPAHLLGVESPPDLELTWTLADGSEVISPAYRATAQIGSFAPMRVLITVLAEEPIVGRARSDRFRITLDHGEQVVVER